MFHPAFIRCYKLAYFGSCLSRSGTNGMGNLNLLPLFDSDKCCNFLSFSTSHCISELYRWRIWSDLNYWGVYYIPFILHFIPLTQFIFDRKIDRCLCSHRRWLYLDRRWLFGDRRWLFFEEADLFSQKGFSHLIYVLSFYCSTLFARCIFCERSFLVLQYALSYIQAPLLLRHNFYRTLL